MGELLLCGNAKGFFSNVALSLCHGKLETGHRGAGSAQSPPCVNGRRRGFVEALSDVMACEASTYYGGDFKEP